MLLILVFCVIRAAVVQPSPDVHTVLPESYDAKPVDGDEYGVRNYVSDHELPRDVPTRVKIVGDLATPPSAVKLDFVPKQTYVQVRRYDAVKRLPQEAALEEAATSEEFANAPRLREVVTHKKTQEVYEEQGYEDAGYDHGGSKKLKVEEEVKDNQSSELIGPNNNSAQNVEETKDHKASIAPSGRGTWSRHKTTTGKRTRYEGDDSKIKVTSNDSSPISEKSSGNFSKFDGGKTIFVQNLTETVKKDSKNEAAESRRVPSISKTRDNVEPTTYRPIMKQENTRNSGKQVRNEQTRNRTRNRPRKRQESAVKKSQTDVVGSYDNSPWIPISPPTDYERRERQKSESKTQVKSKINSYEPDSQLTKYGYFVNHDTPYQYVFPTEISAPESSNKQHRKIRPKPEKSDITYGNSNRSSYANYEFIPQTNYDGSAISTKQKKVKKSSEEDVTFEYPLNNKYKEPLTQLKTNFTHKVKQNGSTINERQKNKSVNLGLSESYNNNPKSESHRNQNKKSHRDVETELESYGNLGSRYPSTFVQDFAPPKPYNAPFITKLKKNNFNDDLRGNPTLRIYPKYEFNPNFQNLKHPVLSETFHGQRPLSNVNKGYTNIELNENPLRSTKHENNRLSDYPKFNRNNNNNSNNNNNNKRQKNTHQQSAESSENWENYPKIGSQTAHLSDQKYSKLNKGENYPKFEANNRFENTGTKFPIYRLTPYEKSVKVNNPYSYVYHDDHYPSGSRYSGVKVEVTTQSPKLNHRNVYSNNRHPHLPKDSIKNISEVLSRSNDKSEDQNTRHVENLTLAHFSGLRRPGSYRPLPLEYNERVNNLAKLLNENYPRRIRRDLEVIHIASSGTTTEIPVDTIIYPHYKKAPKQSALRYATNPILMPRKTAGGMEFYASTDKVQCPDDIAPDNIVPERNTDGEWKGEPSNNNNPRLEALGDKIGCFKTKYFGNDPFDNPIFKERDVGFPEVLFSIKKPTEKKEDGIHPGKPHVEWNFADELIPGNWFPDKDKRSRRSDNNSSSTNHKIQDVISIMSEPVPTTFPVKYSPKMLMNDTKHDIEVSDTEVSSNDEHFLQYSIQHPIPKSETNIQQTHSIDSNIVGLIPPTSQTIMPKQIKKHLKVKKPTVKKILKKVKVDDELNETDLLDVFSPITSIFTNEDDALAAPIIHNFFNIKMAPTAKLKTTTIVDNNSNERVKRYQVQSYRRSKRNMKGVDLQKPKERKLNINNKTNVTLSVPTARVRVYTPKNGTWFRDKRDNISVNVDVRRKEPRYYYHTDRPQLRVKRVVHNPPFYSRTSQIFSSKYLVSDQENSETLPEEINVAFSTTPEYETTPKFIPAIAFGDSKTKMINYNDSVANSTNDFGRSQFDKKDSLIYVINPDTGHGKWMQVIKIKNEEDTKSALTNGPVYLEKKVNDGLSFMDNLPSVKDSFSSVKGSLPSVKDTLPSIKGSFSDETFGKFGFKGSAKDLYKSVFGPTTDHRFKVKIPSRESMNIETIEIPKKADCPNIKRPKKIENRRRKPTTTTTTEIPVVEEVDDRPEEQSGEENAEENVEPQEEVEGGENEEEQSEDQPTDQPQYQQESEENPDNAEDQNEDQDIHESKRKKPYNIIKKPEFSGYYFGSRDKNKNKFLT